MQQAGDLFAGDSGVFGHEFDWIRDCVPAVLAAQDAANRAGVGSEVRHHQFLRSVGAKFGAGRYRSGVEVEQVLDSLITA